MERLRVLLCDKVQREHLNHVSLSTAPARSGSANAFVTKLPNGTSYSRCCWLCGFEVTLRFRLKDTNVLCFKCFRVAYLALVLPIIDTPERRASDKQLLKKIEKLHLEPDTAVMEMSEPAQASFVMSASGVRRRQQHPSPPSSQIRHNSTGADNMGATSVGEYWSCPRCTYIQSTHTRECEACSYVNPDTVTCSLCGVQCPIALPLLPKDGKKSLCKNGEPHCVWPCCKCGAINTIDSTHCPVCGKPRYWACVFCTAVHEIGRSEEKMNYCPTCGSYNSPEDVLIGQVKTSAEQKKADLGGVQQRLGKEGVKADGVVFGLNDAETLAECERQREIELNSDRLTRRLEMLQLKRITQKSDGNCLFAALAHQLFGNARLHSVIRSCIVAYMKANEQDYEVLFDGHDEWRRYTSRMRENGIWGDELCINAAARCFCVNIHVIMSDTTRWHLVFQHEQLGKSESDSRVQSTATKEENSIQSGSQRCSVSTTDTTVCLFLAYKSPVHYDDVTPNEVPSVVLSDLIIPEFQKLLSMSENTDLGGTQGYLSSAPTVGDKKSIKSTSAADFCKTTSLNAPSGAKSPSTSSLKIPVPPRLEQQCQSSKHPTPQQVLADTSLKTGLLSSQCSATSQTFQTTHSLRQGVHKHEGRG